MFRRSKIIRLPPLTRTIRTTTIKLISDLHLELRSSLGHSISTQCCILAGDIGDPFSEQYRSCFCNCGNHEYYQLKSGKTTGYKLCLFTKTILLFEFIKHRPKRFKSLRIIGATLWLHIPFHRLNDFVRSIGIDILNGSIDCNNTLSTNTTTNRS